MSIRRTSSFARKILLGLALGVGAMTVADSANSQEKPMAGEWEVPEGVRTIMLDPAGSTSKCFGIPETPLCALESVLACELFDRPLLCRIVEHPQPWTDDAREIHRGFSAIYVHMSSETLTDADIPDRARDIGTHTWRPGDVAVHLWWNECGTPDGTRCGRWKYLPKIYVTRRAGDSWHIVDVAHPAVPFSEEAYRGRPDGPPGKQKVLTYDLSRSTSGCIDDPVTPLCAAVTWEACHHYYEPDLCATIGYPWSPDTVAVWYKFMFTKLYYRVLAIRRLDGPWTYCSPVYGPCGRAGDVAVEFEQKACDQHGCRVWWTGAGRFITRRSGDRWVFVGWGR